MVENNTFGAPISCFIHFFLILHFQPSKSKPVWEKLSIKFFSKLILSIHSGSLILKIEFVINGRSTMKICSKPSSKLANHIPDSSRFVAYRFVRVFIRFVPIKACVCLFPIWLRDTFSFSFAVPYSDDFFKSKVNSVLLFLKIVKYGY